jgi:hypothetical protein
MQTRENLRWSLPYRLRSDGWWLVDPPKVRPTATLLPFVVKSRPRYAGRAATARKVRS